MNIRLVRNWAMKFGILSVYSAYVLMTRESGIDLPRAEAKEVREEIRRVRIIPLPKHLRVYLRLLKRRLPPIPFPVPPPHIS